MSVSILSVFLSRLVRGWRRGRRVSGECARVAAIERARVDRCGASGGEASGRRSAHDWEEITLGLRRTICLLLELDAEVDETCLLPFLEINDLANLVSPRDCVQAAYRTRREQRVQQRVESTQVSYGVSWKTIAPREGFLFAASS